MVQNNIITGFKRSGIYPFDPKAFNYGTNGSSSAVQMVTVV